MQAFDYLIFRGHRRLVLALIVNNMPEPGIRVWRIAWRSRPAVATCWRVFTCGTSRSTPLPVWIYLVCVVIAGVIALSETR